MDILCKHCGEPWDMAELHDIPVNEGTDQCLTFDDARELFYRYGCGVWNYSTPRSKCTHDPITTPERLEGIAELQAMMGDDIDGLASSYDTLPLVDEDVGTDEWIQRYPILGAMVRGQRP